MTERRGDFTSILGMAVALVSGLKNGPVNRFCFTFRRGWFTLFKERTQWQFSALFCVRACVRACVPPTGQYRFIDYESPLHSRECAPVNSCFVLPSMRRKWTVVSPPRTYASSSGTRWYIFSSALCLQNMRHELLCISLYPRCHRAASQGPCIICSVFGFTHCVCETMST